MAIQTELTDLFEYGIDLKNRRIYFGHMSAEPESATDFTQTSIEFAIRALHRMVSESATKPIELHLNSCGGNPYDALRLHDEILSCPAQVKFYGSGSIMSAATWVMCACDERYVSVNSTIMVHDGSEGYEGKHTDVQINAIESKRLQDLLYDIYVANSRMPKEFWQDVCTRDLYLTANEAIQLGLADKIVEPIKRGNLRKMRQAALKRAPTNAEMKKLLKSVYKRINKVDVPTITLNPMVKEAVDPAITIDTASLLAAQTEKAPQPEVAEPSKENT